MLAGRNLTPEAGDYICLYKMRRLYDLYNMYAIHTYICASINSDTMKTAETMTKCLKRVAFFSNNEMWNPQHKVKLIEEPDLNQLDVRSLARREFI